MDEKLEIKYCEYIPNMELYILILKYKDHLTKCVQ